MLPRERESRGRKRGRGKTFRLKRVSSPFVGRGKEAKKIVYRYNDEIQGEKKGHPPPQTGLLPGGKMRTRGKRPSRGLREKGCGCSKNDRKGDADLESAQWEGRGKGGGARHSEKKDRLN